MLMVLFSQNQVLSVMDEDIAVGASYSMSLGDFSKVWFKVVLAETLLYGFTLVVSNMFICCGEDL